MSLQDVTSSMVGIFQFSIVTLIVLGIAGSLGSMSYFSGSSAFQSAQTALSMMDYVGLFITLGFFIVSVGLAALSRNNRIFLPISIIFLVIDVLLAAIFSDIYMVLVNTGFLGGVVSSIPVMNLILVNFPLMIGVMGLTVILALYTSLGGGRRAAR